MLLVIDMTNNQWRNRNSKSEYGKAEMAFLSLLQEYRIPYISQHHIELPIQPEEERTIHIFPDFFIGNKLPVFIDGDVHLIPKIKMKDDKVNDILTNQMNMEPLRLTNEEVLDKSQEGKDAVMKKVWDKMLKHNIRNI